MKIEIAPVSLTDDGMLVKVSDDELVFVPGRIEARIVGADWDIEFVVVSTKAHDRPVMSELRFVQREGGLPIAPDLVRVKGLKFGEAVDQAVEQGTQPLIRDGDRWIVALQTGTPATTKKVMRRGRGRNVSHDELQAVVDLYRQLRDEPGDTRLNIARSLPDKYRMSRATVDRRLKRAVELGMLDEGE